jgi:hypothetical protein
MVEYNNNSNQETSPYIIVGFDANFGGGGNVTLGWNSAGLDPSLSLGAMPTGSIASLAGTWIVGGAVHGFLNGSRKGATTFGSAPSVNLGHHTVNICGGTYSGQRTGSAITNMACLWLRALSDFEIYALDANPYALFAPADTIMPALFAGGGFKPAWACGCNVVVGGVAT